MQGVSPEELRLIADKQQLQELVHRAARGVNRCDAELLASCYHPDAFEHHGRYQGDIPGLIDYLKQRPMDPNQPPVQHAVTNSLFEVQGDIAFGESYLEVRTVGPDGNVVRTMSRYVDRYEKRDGAWRIARRRVILEGGRPGLDMTPFVQGTRDRSDPSYERG